MPTKEATSLCKTVLRNGYDAYIVNAPLQTALHEKLGINELDIACEPDFETLSKLFPNLERGVEEEVIATWKSEETGILYRFYPISQKKHKEIMDELIRRRTVTN